MSEKHWQVVISCEHASNAVPHAYRSLFAGDDDILTSHRGWDAGAAHFAHALSQTLSHALSVAPSQAGKETTKPVAHCGLWSRLLIDLNRSPSHPQRFSEFSRPLGKVERQKLHTDYYQPFRDAIATEIEKSITTGTPVLHISVHSFTPVLDGKLRDVDIGLLYDPSRPNELALARHWQALLKIEQPALRVRRNNPYRGIADGHCTGLRRRFSDAQYAGFELELNQALLVNGKLPDEISANLQLSLSQLILRTG